MPPPDGYVYGPLDAKRSLNRQTLKVVTPLPSSSTHHYNFHGVRLSVRANNEELAGALRARLEPFSAPPAEPELTFTFSCVTEQHRVQKPPGPSRPVYDAPEGEVLYFESVEGGALFVDVCGRVRVLSEPLGGHTEVSYVRAQRDNLWLLSRPMFTLPLIETLKRRGLYNLHAAGLCKNGRALLLPGSSGSGKSTLTLALLRAGWGFMSDDMVFLRDEGLRVLAFPDEIDFTGETARLLSFSPQLKLSGGEKYQLTAEALGANVVREGEPAALVFPRVARTDESTLHPMTRDEALLELLPNVLLTEARSSQAHVDALGALVAACPAYRLETGRDFERLSAMLEELLT